MLEENSLEEIKKFWPKDAPDIFNVPKYIKKYKNDLIVSYQIWWKRSN